MTAVTAKMGGLQVEQTTEYYPISNYLNNVTQQRQTVPVGYVTVCDPTFINETIIKLAATDEKFYFRQEKLTGMMHNQSACDVFVDLQYIHCRRNILKGEFPTLGNLLQDNAISPAYWLTNVTSSNTAQRYLKFGKHKRFIMRSGHLRKFSLRSKKYPGNKQISQDVEGNSLFLGTKYWTRWCWIKCTPAPWTYYNTVSNPPTIDPSPIVQPVQLNVVLSRYTAWYQVGVNNPASVYSKDFGVPATGSTSDSHTWTDTQVVTSTIPP